MTAARTLLVVLLSLLVILPLTTAASGQDAISDLVLNCTGPAGDPAEGTPQFQVRDAQNIACTQQRRLDRGSHPMEHQRAQMYGADPYRVPSLHDGVRFRHEELTIDGVASELFLPCTPATCTDVPEGVGVFADGPYPVAVILHGALSDKRHMWWIAQPLAEEGYAVLTMNGTSGDLPDIALGWVNGEAQTSHPGIFDTDRVGIAGHSLGAENATSTNGDPRVHAIVAWDPCNSASGCSGSPGSKVDPEDPTKRTPTLYVTAEYEGWPGYPERPFTSVPDTLRVEGYTTLRERGVDSMLVTLRATTHLDFVQAFVDGNRLAEATTAYYTLAWFDRYVEGRYVPGETDPVVDAADRAERTAIARSGYERLIAEEFDASVDRHNISMGTWDPVKAVTSGDVRYGGNVPYAIEGMPTADRMSFYYRSTCFVSAPDHTAGDDVVAARADSTPDGNMRLDGCPVVFDTAS